MPSSTPPSFFKRLPLAFGAFFSILGNPVFASRVLGLSQPETPVPSPVPAPAPAPTPAPLKEASSDAALQLLALLQRDARLIDFTQENLSSYSDAEIGGAARVVHEGCAKVLREHFTLAPVRAEEEGSRITLAAGFDARAIRLTGNVVGQAPFQGALSHRGWRATETRLPKLAEGHDATVLAQAEVEL
ncbi:DUF2760 domain-containing protein [Polaromonas sp. SM01]|uniref:DUF2760 domain-containing protein n=1 Tax=Polaromonas sp. SM01 TaxID=3085630 RepID=UPI0029812F5F|nr:DUF2760 domain-containing protein [Polaromonas sp. SM01]MDW5441599.1 DUF2760 domain-containing protein [Polaromonas sp. SM01]